MDRLSLGNRIRTVREQARFSQEDIAKMLEVTPATINRYENNHRIPDADFLNRLVIKFNCDPGWLLTGEGSMHLEEKKDILMVKEAPTPYGVKAQPAGGKEREYLDKLTMIFRFKDEETIKAITQNIDQFLRVPNKETTLESQKKDKDVA